MNPQRNTTTSSCPPAHGCPDRTTLSDLMLGRLPPDSIDHIGSHVEGCAACQTALDSLDDVEDSVVRGLRSSARSPWDQLDPSWAEQLRRAEAIGPVTCGGSREGDDDDAPLPERLGQYELLEQIGRGGMGTVYKALHVRLKRHVAMKLLPAERVLDPQAVARFEREI